MSQVTSRAAALSCLVGLSSLGCSGDDDSGGWETVSAATAAAVYSEIECAYAEQCAQAFPGDAQDRAWLVGADICDDGARYGGGWLIPHLPETLRLDRAQAAACRRRVVETCLRPYVLPECVGLTVGTGEVGDGCGGGRACGAGLYCEYLDDDCGACLRAIPPGERCTWSSVCASTADRRGICVFDDGDDEEGTCRQYGVEVGAPLGAPCGRVDAEGAMVACAQPGYCRFPMLGFEVFAELGTCARPIEGGEVCEEYVDACEGTLGCEDGLCVGYAVAGPGESCSAEGADCNPYLRLVCIDGVCAHTDGAVGSRCGLVSCAEGNQCDYGADPMVCKALISDGDACDYDFDCASGACEDDICQPPEVVSCGAR